VLLVFVIHSFPLHHPFALVRHPPQRHSAQNQVLQLLPLILSPHPHPIDTQPLHPSSIDLPISLGTPASSTTTIQLVDLLYTWHICHFSQYRVLEWDLFSFDGGCEVGLDF